VAQRLGRHALAREHATDLARPLLGRQFFNCRQRSPARGLLST
jgi:hypothetical protein